MRYTKKINSKSPKLIRVYTLRDGSEKKIPYYPNRSLKEEMKLLNITESDIFQMQLIESPLNK
ncbi:hypothetical protein NDK43_20860 [Neobacillus pocheonensis]|uniref:Uncharacterized protein n=1 Tax=Neobacillus pocheonensis TaxID=363869 RepID=A0ABT0WE68_9BACI|nr:hypothetical protein [Neobacillus pocheonensis]